MKLSNNKLDNKIILVTGANIGIGRAAAIAYAMQGARLILLGRDMNSLEEVMMRLRTEIVMSQ